MPRPNKKKIELVIEEVRVDMAHYGVAGPHFRTFTMEFQDYDSAENWIKYFVGRRYYSQEARGWVGVKSAVYAESLERVAHD